MDDVNRPNNPSVRELKRGYRRAGKRLLCIYCSHVLEKGMVYSVGDRFLTARRAMEEHILSAHGGHFTALAAGGVGHSGLSEVQLKVMQGMFRGEKDGEIARLLGNKAKSTVRNHRYQLRERYREAKVLVAMTELLHDLPRDEQLVEYPLHIQADDMRLVVTEKEKTDILKKYMPQGQLLRFPKKEKEKLVILQRISDGFSPGREYSEKEINQYIAGVYEDYVTLRRYLVEYGFLDRVHGGRKYWLRES
jgi:hypothetical protein